MSTRGGLSPTALPCHVMSPSPAVCALCCPPRPTPPRSITRTSNEKFFIERSVAIRSNARCNIRSITCCNIRTRLLQHQKKTTAVSEQSHCNARCNIKTKKRNITCCNIRTKLLQCEMQHKKKTNAIKKYYLL